MICYSFPGWRRIMPKRTLDATDRKILAQLQADGRMSLAELAEKVGLSPSPCLRRVRMLEKDGVIARYVAVLDQRAVGLPVSVFVSIKLEKQRQEALDRIRAGVKRPASFQLEVVQRYIDLARVRAYNGVASIAGHRGRRAGGRRRRARCARARRCAFPTETVKASTILPDLDKYKGPPLEFGRMEPTASDPRCSSSSA
jgi:DNA-binding Lrp family transcriptional regulator